ncbi:MAG: hypothetical protein HY699_11470 [Deltaproteobacteria bacterium]|nr:hypothetical protein [Deltaproteobacteria bacterium]
MDRAWKIMAAVAIALGAAAFFYSFYLPPGSSLAVLSQALGASLVPAGIISIITSVASSHVIEQNLTGRFDSSSSALRDHIASLGDAAKQVGHTVSAGLQTATGELQQSIDDLRITNDFLSRARDLGVVMIYENRNQALDHFLDHLEEFVSRGQNPDAAVDDKREVVFVASSLRGVIEDDPKYAAQLERIIASRGKAEMRFLLTHPIFSELREAQESRPPGGIAVEILHAIAWLEDRGVPPSDIRVYKGTPTCFMVASSERMLINPYPYQREAYRSFCIEAVSTRNERGVYHSFWVNHYMKPWYGEDKRRDHFIQPNALRYVHEVLDGPFPQGWTVASQGSHAFADFFVIHDPEGMYLAVNVRGLEKTIAYERDSDGSCKELQVGDTLSVRLLDLTTCDPKWSDVGQIQLDRGRNGFWHRKLSDYKSFSSYAMIGVFDDRNQSPFHFEKNPKLEGQNLPLMWKWFRHEDA